MSNRLNMHWNKYLALTHAIVGIWVISFYFNATIGIETRTIYWSKFVFLIFGLTFVALTYGFYKIKNWARVTSLIMQWLAFSIITLLFASLIYKYGLYLELIFEALYFYGFLVMGILILKQPTIVELYAQEKNS
jgi:hypothetical protein